MSRTIIIIRWGKDVCGFLGRTVESVDCETCQWAYTGNYTLKETICGYNISEETKNE